MPSILEVKETLRRDASDFVRLFRVVKYELDALASHISGSLARRGRPLEMERGLKINVASGGHRSEGWLHLDGVPGSDVRADLRRRWPLPDGCARLIYCEHFLDHLEHPYGAQKFARECLRVLEPGGTIRVVVHDLELIARAYLARDERFFVESGFPAPTFAESVNQVARFNDYHRFMYDFDSLHELLNEAGFVAITRSAFRGSSNAELNIDIDLPERAVQSLYVEARRPA